MRVNRRTFLKSGLATGAVVMAAAAGLLKPTRVLAAAWPRGAFEAKSVQDALQKIFGQSQASASKDVIIKAPMQAENGAVVPVTISTTLPDVESIGVLVEKNSTPLITTVNFSQGAAPFFAARIKMAKTSNVNAYVKAGGKLHVASQQVKVTVGGCGG